MSEEQILMGKMFHNLEKLKRLHSESPSEDRHIESNLAPLLSKIETFIEKAGSVEVKDSLKELSQKLQEQETEMNDLYRSLAKRDRLLVKNGKEIIALTHEKCLLLDVIENAPNRKELLSELEKLKQLPVV